MISAGGVIFAYDGDGNRISKGSTYFVNDVNMPLPQVLLEQDEAGNTIASYTYGLELISLTKGDATYYYLYDGLGNVVAVTDGTGQTVQSYDYDAFGNVINTTGERTNPYQFVGGYGCTAENEGLVYMRARYYAPEIGRFISRDPWEGTPYDPQSLNRYVYCSNNPVNWVDPVGLWELYGNWGGPGWTGGQKTPLEYLTPEQRKKLKQPIDAMDECFKEHDERYSDCREKRKEKEKCEEGPKKFFKECIRSADRALYLCLRNLDKDPRKWPKSAPDPKKAERYRRWAEGYFFWTL